MPSARQAGKTYFANNAAVHTLNFETVIEDAKQVTQHLQQRFGVEKIALMGQLGEALRRAGRGKSERHHRASPPAL